MENVFKITDRVYSFPFGWGYVEDVSDERNYVRILFDSGNSCDFRDKGYETISFTEYKLEGFSQERPEELPKKGDIVWVRDIDYEEEWQVAFFVDKADNSFIVTRYNPFDGNNFMNWKEMTTKNPYANEQ